MGTRSIVALPEGAHGFKGRYIHWDGYPEGVGASLVEILKRDGGNAVDVLIHENYGWSNLDPDKDDTLPDMYQDGRFKAVPGYGVAYTTVENQSSPDDWHTRENAEESWCEWAYVIHPDYIQVYANKGGKWVSQGRLSL